MLYIVTDAASRGNPGMAACSWYVYTKNPLSTNLIDNEHKFVGHIYLGNPISNNEAEYSAVLYSILSILPSREHSLTIISDSELIVKQLSGIYNINSEVLKTKYNQIKYLEKYYYLSITYINQPRTNQYIRKCDKRCNEVLDTLSTK